MAVAVPVAGIAVAVAVEEADYREWRKEHPEPTSEVEARKQYIEEVVRLTKVVLVEERDDALAKYPGLKDAVSRHLEELKRKFAPREPSARP